MNRSVIMSADKTAILRAFNTHFADMLSTIVSIYPENSDLVSSRNSLETVRRMNPSLPIKIWHTYVHNPYYDVIKQGDLDYFLNKDYKDDLTYVKNSDEVLKIVDRLRGPLRHMNGVDRNKTIKYLQNLNELSKMYAIMKTGTTCSRL